MAIEVVTKQDLEEMRSTLLADIIDAIKVKYQAPKQWLKGKEIKNLLKISSGTLQNLRTNGSLPYTKVGSIIFYNYDDVQKLLDLNKMNINPQRKLSFKK